MLDWLRDLFTRRPDPWEQQWLDTEPMPGRDRQRGGFVPPRPLPRSQRVGSNPGPTYARPPAPPRPPPAVPYIERRDAKTSDVPINRDNGFLLGIATATLLAPVHSGGCASGSWDTDTSSTSSSSSSD